MAETRRPRRRSSEDINKSFLELKAENDKGRKADKEVLAKIEADLAKATPRTRSAIAAAEAKAAAADARADAIEKLMGRMQLGGPRGEKAKELLQAAASSCRTGTSAPARSTRRRRSSSRCSRRATTPPAACLASPEFSADIIKDVVLFSPMRGLVRVRSSSKGEYKARKRTGVSTAAWVAELETRVESTNPAYGMSTRSSRTR
jgi:HK97 family phage major capsid protein